MLTGGTTLKELLISSDSFFVYQGVQRSPLNQPADTMLNSGGRAKD